VNSKKAAMLAAEHALATNRYPKADPSPAAVEDSPQEELVFWSMRWLY
jgi:hypothetical protein